MRTEGAELPKGVAKRLDALASAVLRDVKPTPREADVAKRMINEIMGRLKRAAPKNVEILLAGSVARGTNVRGNSDIDIFLLFPKTMTKEQIERKGLQIGKSIVDKGRNERYIVKYAEHPYTRIMFADAGINADIVPAYKISNARDMGTAVDRTQLHNKFVNDNMKEAQRDQVRVLKTFFKSHNIYGAEARVEGFSGYLCELLVYHYGSFNNVVLELSRLRLPTVIDVLSGERMTGSGKEADRLVKKFPKGFIVIDPTDSDRNVAASVSEESLARAMLISRGLMAKPTRESFFAKGYSDVNSAAKINAIAKELGAMPYVLLFRLPEIAEDITWQQLKKLGMRVGELLDSAGFSKILAFNNIRGRDGLIVLFISNQKLSSTIVRGPSVSMGKSVDAFIKAHKDALGISFMGDRIYAIERARYSTPEELMRSIISDKKMMLPSTLDRKTARLYVGKLPEEMAKLVYQGYLERMSL
ncbi:MAG: CCA tRNA nucleotidyltransferase [Candidatus Micrarchaeota archaeon]|nr:CCA tRNA nucleotidyltransferase [Candidatus Micrarchaeota archaeon]